MQPIMRYVPAAVEKTLAGQNLAALRVLRLRVIEDYVRSTMVRMTARKSTRVIESDKEYRAAWSP